MLVDCARRESELETSIVGAEVRERERERERDRERERWGERGG